MKTFYEIYPRALISVVRCEKSVKAKKKALKNLQEALAVQSKPGVLFNFRQPPMEQNKPKIFFGKFN